MTLCDPQCAEAHLNALWRDAPSFPMTVLGVCVAVIMLCVIISLCMGDPK